MGPLQLLSHVVQNPHANEKNSHQERQKTNLLNSKVHLQNDTGDPPLSSNPRELASGRLIEVPNEQNL